jgi:hypothetical protein
VAQRFKHREISVVALGFSPRRDSLPQAKAWFETAGAVLTNPNIARPSERKQRLHQPAVLV